MELVPMRPVSIVGAVDLQIGTSAMFYSRLQGDYGNRFAASIDRNDRNHGSIESAELS